MLQECCGAHEPQSREATVDPECKAALASRDASRKSWALLGASRCTRLLGSIRLCFVCKCVSQRGAAWHWWRESQPPQESPQIAQKWCSQDRFILKRRIVRVADAASREVLASPSRRLLRLPHLLCIVTLRSCSRFRSSCVVGSRRCPRPTALSYASGMLRCA